MDVKGLEVQFLEILAPVTVRLTIVQITFLCAYFWDGLYFHIVSSAIFKHHADPMSFYLGNNLNYRTFNFTLSKCL